MHCGTLGLTRGWAGRLLCASWVRASALDVWNRGAKMIRPRVGALTLPPASLPKVLTGVEASSLPVLGSRMCAMRPRACTTHFVEGCREISVTCTSHVPGKARCVPVRWMKIVDYSSGRLSPSSGRSRSKLRLVRDLRAAGSIGSSALSEQDRETRPVRVDGCRPLPKRRLYEQCCGLKRSLSTELSRGTW